MTSFCIKETNDNCAEKNKLSVKPLMLSFPWIGTKSKWEKKKFETHEWQKLDTSSNNSPNSLILCIIYNIVLRRMPWLSERDAINVIVIIRMWTFLKVDLPDVTNVLHLQCQNWNLIARMLRALQFCVSFFFISLYISLLAGLYVARRIGKTLCE